MKFDFDHVIDRSGGDSFKWNRYIGRDVLPLWVADMDFAAPPAIVDALQARVTQGVFGYGDVPSQLNATVVAHLARDYAWSVEPSWLVWLPGLVSGLNIACRAVGAPGDAVFTATPIYPPFLSAPLHAQRRLRSAPLHLEQDAGASVATQRWSWDLAATQAALADDTRLFLLCHPHNPVGRAWHDEELQAIAALAERHDLVVCSDEIHCGLMLEPGRRHRPFATLGKEASRRSITLMAPSKTFNIPGLGAAFAVIPDAALRQRFRAAAAGIVPHVNLLGLVAAQAAYASCADWQQALLAYLRDNRACVAAAVAALPALALAPVEATYLAWIDARRLAGRVGKVQAHFEAAGVGLADGEDFGGEAYRGFVRLNFGCPRATLVRALARIAAAAGGA